MSFVITAGGTAGHISPALAVAAELEKLNEKVIFVGSVGGMEERLARAAGLEYKDFAARGFNRQRPWTLLSSGLVLARSAGEARTWLRSIDAQAVGAFGGYVSVPVGQAAAREGIALLIHEQNSAMGWTNRHLSKQATTIALSYGAAASALSSDAKKRVHLTGNPVRSEFTLLVDSKYAARLRSEFRGQMGLTEDQLVVLVFGGSQGARHINQAVVDLAPELMKRQDLVVLHLTGRKEFTRVEAALKQALSQIGSDADNSGGSTEAGVVTISAVAGVKTFTQATSTVAGTDRWKLLDYCDQMPAAFAASDIVVSRAGASSLAELAAAAKPALLIPYPFATADHQRKNAETLVASGAAHMVLDAELDTPRFAEALLSLIDNVDQRKAMLDSAKAFQGRNAAAQVAELLVSIARQ